MTVGLRTFNYGNYCIFGHFFPNFPMFQMEIIRALMIPQLFTFYSSLVIYLCNCVFSLHLLIIRIQTMTLFTGCH